MFAEYLASKKQKICLVSVYLETMEEIEAQSILMKLIEKALHAKQEKEGATA